MKPYFILALLLISVASGQVYNTTALDNSNNPYEYAVNLNTLMDNGIGLAILLIVSVISFTVGQSSDNNPFSGLAAAAFFSGLSATILLPLLLIDLYTYQFVIIADAVVMAVVFLFGGRR